MMILLSPAKSLDFTTPSPVKEFYLPRFLQQETAELAGILRTKSSADLAQLMRLSKALAELNYQRFQDYRVPFPPKQAKQAVFAFVGDVYQGLEATSLSAAELNRAQQSLRILSGFYGLLTPLDLILPYRLEMGTKLATTRGENLYRFWGGLLAKGINEEAPSVILNLASNEYFKAVPAKKLQALVIGPRFYDESKGQYKVISFLAKRARGLMTRWVLRQGATCEGDLKEFNLEGYRYSLQGSKPGQPLFIRPARDRP